MRTALAVYFQPFFADPPAFVLVLTIWLYGAVAGIMILRSRRTNRQAVGLIPQQPFEKRLWFGWAPLLVLWVLMPGLAVKRRLEWLVIPEFVLQDPFFFWLRWAGALGAVLAFGVVISCWLRMGSSWRIAVMPRHKTDLVTGGLYASIRHPIYAFNILLVLCSMVVVPTLPMILVATPHIVFMVLKAHREEEFMREAHGEKYIEYCKRTGRFFPRRGSHQVLR